MIAYLSNLRTAMSYLSPIRALCLISLLSCTLASSSAYAQRGGAGTVTIKETFAPAFRIEPLVNRISGRPGDIIQFRFDIEATNLTNEVSIAPVGLRQELNGLITHDEGAVPTGVITLTTPDRMKLSPDQGTVIEGVIKIPPGNAAYHSFGILVKDLGDGQPISPRFDADGKPQTQAAIRFITQYVLRLDIVVEGARGERLEELLINEVQVAAQAGRPKLQTFIENPTDTTFEFNIRARLRNAPSDHSFKPMRLVMPVRASMENEDRYVGRILPKSRIRMEEMIPDAILGGHYEVDVELLSNDRVLKKRTLPLDVNEADYPAQAVLLAQLAEGLQVTPAQIELSQLRGGQRRLTLSFKNTGKVAHEFKLNALDVEESPLNSVIIQPTEFTLPPGGTRKVSLTLKGTSKFDAPTVYGHIQVATTGQAEGFARTKFLPLAILFGKSQPTRVELSKLRFDPSGNAPTFKVPVTNKGERHMALDARLLIIDEQGNRMSVPGGFGRWLFPAETASLEFRLQQPLSPGEYTLRCELQTDGPPATVEQTFSVSDIENSK